jgi:hypothetical protein
MASVLPSSILVFLLFVLSHKEFPMLSYRKVRDEPMSQFLKAKKKKPGLFVNFGEFPCSWIRIRIPIMDPDPGQPKNADPNPHHGYECLALCMGVNLCGTMLRNFDNISCIHDFVLRPPAR